MVISAKNYFQIYPQLISQLLLPTKEKEVLKTVHEIHKKVEQKASSNIAYKTALEILQNAEFYWLNKFGQTKPMKAKIENTAQEAQKDAELAQVVKYLKDYIKKHKIPVKTEANV